MSVKRFAGLTLLIILFCFCVFFFLFNEYKKKWLIQEMDRHAEMIKEDVWATDFTGPSGYLNLAAEREDYAKIELKNMFDENLLIIEGPKLVGIDYILEISGLLPQTIMISAVKYNDQIIGTLIAHHRNMSVYIHFYVFLLFALIYAVIIQFRKIVQVKMGLEDNVRERTDELNDANQQLSQNIKILNQAQEISHLGHFDYNLIDKTLAWSDEIYRIYEQDPKTFTPTYEKYFGKMHPEDRAIAEKEYFTSIEKKRGFDFEARIFLDNGINKYIQNMGKTEYDEQGEPIRTIGMILDITINKQAEKEKIEAQQHAAEQEKMALVGTVAGKMAHDFNNILGVVMGNTELALIDCKDGDTKKILELIFEQTMRGKNLTKNLVAFAKDQEPKQEFFKISKKIDLVLSLMKKDLEGIDLKKEDKSGVPDLLADPGMIEHALVNLIQNSIHALSKIQKPKIVLRSFYRDKKIWFEIEDNGCGISEEYLENIFDPSFTLKGSKDNLNSYKNDIKGTGYGLSNVKRYIEMHKGKISVDSELNLGTKFVISFPVIKKELTSEEKIEIREKFIHFKKNILLVEDEIDISNVQYKVLTQEPCNHNVDIANNGQIAMDLFDRNQYDIVSLDYILPGAINGMIVYNHIRKNNKKTPILFISGNIEFLESIKDLKQRDILIDHLSKPCQNKDYVNGINKLLEKSLAEQ